MSLPPALLARLAQRGLVQKKATATQIENEEVIAEDYDEMDTLEQQRGPESYDAVKRKAGKREDNFWLERIKARMVEATDAGGQKGCPNKYNIWHKCTLFCVNRWGDGIAEPSREYMRRYKRLRRKYPLPKGWTEMYDPGCGCYYFYSAAEALTSWLPPTHPQSQVSRTAASLRRQLDETSGDCGGSDGEQMDDDVEDHDSKESSEARHHREIDDIISSSLRAPRSPPQQQQHQVPPPLVAASFPSLQESANAPGPQRKQKSRDVERVVSRQRRDRERDRHVAAPGRGGRHGRHGAADALDPMDPSAYSDIPRGKWSDGLHTGAGEERNKKPASSEVNESRKRGTARSSDDDGDDNDDVDGDYR